MNSQPWRWVVLAYYKWCCKFSGIGYPWCNRISRSTHSAAWSPRDCRRCQPGAWSRETSSSKSVLFCVAFGLLSLTFAAAKTADLILIMLDATKSEEQRRLLEIELDAVGIRLNKRKPDVVFKRRTTGGVSCIVCLNWLLKFRLAPDHCMSYSYLTINKIMTLIHNSWQQPLNSRRQTKKPFVPFLQAVGNFFIYKKEWPRLIQSDRQTS